VKTRPGVIDEKRVKQIQEISDFIAENVEKVIVGKREVIELFQVALLCEGHILIEDVPGVGKTMLARAMATSLGCNFRRIQCTPDLLPSDIMGVSVFNQKIQEFEFRPGPVMTSVLLVDEINRATPRTQSSLLECMAERQITVDGVTYRLPRPFLVIATQNPIEYEGTFPLPEAQLDRFLMRIRIGYPSFPDESEILLKLQRKHPIEDLQPVVKVDQLLKIQEWVREIYLADSLRNYAIQIVHSTREHSDVALGASPRGTLALFKTSQALAAIRGRNYVLPDDIKRLVFFTLGHRIILKPESLLRGLTGDKILEGILSQIDVPVETNGAKYPRE